MQGARVFSRKKRARVVCVRARALCVSQSVSRRIDKLRGAQEFDFCAPRAILCARGQKGFGARACATPPVRTSTRNLRSRARRQMAQRASESRADRRLADRRASKCVRVSSTCCCAFAFAPPPPQHASQNQGQSSLPMAQPFRRRSLALRRCMSPRRPPPPSRLCCCCCFCYCCCCGCSCLACASAAVSN